MHRRTRTTLVGIASAMLLFAALPALAAEMLTCGWDEVRALRLVGTNVSTVWTWKATNSNLPESFKLRFSTTSECKPCPGGKVLITSSGGGALGGAVALVDRLASNVLFYAVATNAHSAELLPSNRVVVALSYGTNGNRLAVFDLATPDVELFSVPLWGAHGVVWDEPRQTLWGLSDSFIAGYKLTNWNSNPDLLQVSWTGLLDGGGHDLYPVPDSPHLIVTTALHCWLFDRDTRYFTKHPLLGDTTDVKGVSVEATSGRIVYVQADGPWWSEHLRFLAPSNTLDFPGDHLYKARWIPPEVPPQLSILRTSTNTAVILWPAISTEFNLQQNTSPGTTNWSAPLEPVGDDGTNKFILIQPATGQRFFRLIKTSP